MKILKHLPAFVAEFITASLWCGLSSLLTSAAGRSNPLSGAVMIFDFKKAS